MPARSAEIEQNRHGPVTGYWVSWIEEESQNLIRLLEYNVSVPVQDIEDKN
jgi:hypothetical protein